MTGAALHCLPALQKAVAMRSLAERSLKTIRVETSNDGQRIVGMRFPVYEGFLDNLRKAIEAQDGIGRRCLFVDQVVEAINAKSYAWATTAPPSLTSFFKKTKRNRPKRALAGDDLEGKAGQKHKTRAVEARTKNAGRKVAPITSFFKKVPSTSPLSKK